MNSADRNQPTRALAVGRRGEPEEVAGEVEQVEPSRGPGDRRVLDRLDVAALAGGQGLELDRDVAAELDQADLPPLLHRVEVHADGDGDLRDVGGEPEAASAALQGLLAPVLAAAHRAVEEAVDVDQHQGVGLLRDALEQLAEDPAVPRLGPSRGRQQDGREENCREQTATDLHEDVLSIGEEGSQATRCLGRSLWARPSGIARSSTAGAARVTTGPNGYIEDPGPLLDSGWSTIPRDVHVGIAAITVTHPAHLGRGGAGTSDEVGFGWGWRWLSSIPEKNSLNAFGSGSLS